MLNISKPTKLQLDSWVTGTSNDVKRVMIRADSLYHYLAAINDADLATMGYGADEIYAIRAFGVALENIFLRFKNQAPLDTSNPSQFVEVLNQPLLV